MKKITTLLHLILLCAASLFAQAPEKFTYQAVVRNTNNSLVVNAQVGVRVNILQGSASGNAVYSESHVTTSNANGLVTVNIGGGSVLHGSFAGIDWSDGPYFLKTDIDPNGGNDYTITSTQQLLSVPYALYATEAGNGFSGDYNDLTNTPQIPQVPADISAFNNDAGYITMDSLPIVPTAVSAFTNDAGYLTGYTETDPLYNAWNKDYNDLINKPTIPVVPTNVSAFTNDVGYITSAAIPTMPTNVSAFTNDAGYITAAQVPAQVNADWNATAGAAQILNKPTLFSGNYNDLTNKPSLFSGSYNDLTNKPVLFDGNYNSLTNRPNLAAVAISGSYNDLINKPSIPTAVGELANNVGYITLAQVPAQVNADWNATTGAAQILNKPTLFSGNYNDLTNKPVIPTVPTNVSAFTNDAGYLTSANVQQAAGIPTNVSAFTNDAGYITAQQVPAQVNADWNATTGAAQILNKPSLFSGNYADLINKPTLFDGNYNSLSNRPNLATVATTGNYNDLTNKPTIPAAANDATLTILRNGSSVGTFSANASANSTVNISVPTTTSELTNNSGFITAQDIPAIPTVPTNVSAFTNDAHYITQAQLNALLSSMNNTIDSLRDRIGELEYNQSQSQTNTSISAQACLGLATVTDYDRNVYNTVQIGNQCWMRENLRSTHYADGAAIASGTSSSGTTAYYYPLQGDFTYGYLYNWEAVMRSSSSSQSNPSGVQGICPNGWHVPSDAEWDELENYVSSQSQYLCNDDNNYLAKALAAKTGWVSSTGSCVVGNVQVNNNATGFSALPAGHNYGGSYTNYGTVATFWSSTEAGSANTFDRSVDYSNAVVTRSNHPKGYGFSVRCLRDGGNSSLLPTVSTMGVTSITATTAVTGGNITDDGGSAVTTRGVCWSISHNPTIAGNHTNDGEGVGSFTSTLTGLTAGTTYFVRAYATNGNGTKYGDEVSFSTPLPFICGTSTVSDIEGHVYNTVQIGAQCWMKENMRATKYANGTSITRANTSQSSSITRYYYDPGNATNYGYLYNWPAAKGPYSDNQGICPDGWHVPSDGEWTELTQYVGSQSNFQCSNSSNYVAKALAATTGWSTNTNTCAVGNTPSSNNATGFSALPAGYCSGDCRGSGLHAYFWSATEVSSDYARYRSLGYNYAGVYSYIYNDDNYKSRGYSVRCLRD